MLCLLALFTHNNLLWGAALILAMIDLPDIATPLSRISHSLERMTRSPRRAEPDREPPAEPAAAPAPVETEQGHA